MKKIVTISIVVVVALAFGFFLFKISPDQQNGNSTAQEVFDLSGVKKTTQPAALKDSDHILGNPAAKNVFIAYEDYQCPACAAYNDILKQVPLVFEDTKLVFRYFPLTQIHKNAVLSAYASEAAHEQGKFWPMHDLLFENQTKWQDLADPSEFFANLAVEAGVANIEQFKSDMASKKYKTRIQEDLVDSLSMDLPGTPSFFFNGHNLLNQDLAGLKKQAEQFYIK